MAQDIFNSIVGWVSKEDSIWSTAHNSSSGTITYWDKSYLPVFTHYSSPNYINNRSFLVFNTSSIPNDNIITSAQLKLYCDYLGGHGTGTIGIVQTTQISESTLVVDDYSLCGSTHGATEGATRVTVTSIGWHIWDLNTIGLEWISKTGNTLLGVRTWQDLDDSSPIDGKQETIVQFAGNKSTGTRAPQLIVNHYPIVTQPLGFLQGLRKSGKFLTGLKQESKNDMLKKTGGFLGGYGQESKYKMKRKTGGFLGGSKKAQ